MKIKPKFLLTSLLAFVSISIFSCNKLHIHEYEWKYDEDNHWQECIHCRERIGETTHKMSSSNDTCLVCGYKDPVVTKDVEGEMTGLTKWAKTKTNVTIPEGVLYVGKESLKDSAATYITIHKSLVGIHYEAFDGSNIPHSTIEEAGEHIITDPTEGKVVWTKYGDYYYKHDEAADKEAMVDGKFYETLAEAMKAVKEDNTTITLLTKNIKSTGTIEVNYDVNLEATNESCELPSNLEFVIGPAGSLRITSNIHYKDNKGNVKLLLGEIKERVGDTNEETIGYTSGSLVFLDKTEELDPENFTVEYVKSIDDEEPMYANGANQYELLKGDCFVYGTFKVDKSMNDIIGLTDYGATLNRLTVNNPIKNKNFAVHDWAFTTPTQIRIKIPLKDIKINLDMQKGAYRHLTIGEGITKIGYRAFSNWHDKSQIPSELITVLAPIIAPLTILDINSSTLTDIGEAAFYFCAGLTDVTSTLAPNLKTMGVAVFQECFNLKNVDLSGCILLERIKKHAFMGDTNLTNLKLANNVGWQFGSGFGYVPEEIANPATAAFLAVHAVYEKEWVRNANAKFCYYNPLAKDKEGRYSHVFYTNDFEAAYKESNDGYVISVCDKDAKFDTNINLDKSIKISVCKDYEGATLGEVNVAPGKHVIIDSKLLKEDTDIILKCDGKDGEYKNVSGVAISNDENSKSNDNYEIYISNSNSGPNRVNNIKKCKLTDGKAYDAFGLFNFKINDGNPTEKLNSLSNLGKLTTELEVSKQLAGTNESLADNLFAGNDHIRKVTFGENVYTIPRHALADNISNTIEEAVYKCVRDFNYRAFAGCKKLSVVNFSEDTNLEIIGEQAFTDCPNLKKVSLPNDCKLKKIGKNAFNKTSLTEFDFANIKNKWKAGGHAFNDTELTLETAAKYLTNDYKSVEWTRS